MEDLHDDDQPIGRLLDRREVLRLFGATAAGAAVLTGMGIDFQMLTRPSVRPRRPPLRLKPQRRLSPHVSFVRP